MILKRAKMYKPVKENGRPLSKNKKDAKWVGWTKTAFDIK